MQLIFLLLWVLGLGIWLTVLYFIRTQMRTIDSIRPQIKFVFILLIVSCLVFFGIALMNIINYKEGGNSRTLTPSVPVLQPTNPLRSTTNEKIY